MNPKLRPALPRVLATALWLVSLAPPVFAHGDVKHVLGTVREVGVDRVVVETRDGGKESIAINADTKYYQEDATAKPDELKVGDRVVVHATQSDPSTATVIRFSTPKSAK